MYANWHLPHNIFVYKKWFVCTDLKKTKSYHFIINPLHRIIRLRSDNPSWEEEKKLDNRPTDGRTYPLIEMLVASKKKLFRERTDHFCSFHVGMSFAPSWVVNYVSDKYIKRRKQGQTRREFSFYLVLKIVSQKKRPSKFSFLYF